MNSLKLQIAAAKSVEEFEKHNDTSCVLYIRDGLVCCCPTREKLTKSPTCLIFSRIQQRLGLSKAGWTMVGNTLFNLYNKEQACQAHQKH